MKLDDTKRMRLMIELIGAGLCLVATGVFYVLGLGPLLSRKEDAATHQAKITAQQSIALDLKRSLTQDRAKLAEAERELAQSPLQLAPATDVNKRISLMTDLARECGLKLDVVLPGMPSAGNRYERVPIHISGTGNYGTCVSLLHRLRQEFPDTTVTSLKLDADPSDAKAVARFSIDLLWHASPKLFARAGAG